MIHSKRAVVSGLVLALALVHVACRKEAARQPPRPDDTRPAEPATATTPTGRPAGAKIKIAFSAPSADHGWTGAISVNAKKQAARYDDVEFSLTQAPTAADQVSQLNTIMMQKPDVLVILPQDETVTPAALAAMKAGIPVINVDREFSDPGAQRAVIKGDNYGVGFQAGQYFASELKCKGNVVEIQGIAGISVTNQRTKGFADAIAQCKGGIKIVMQAQGVFKDNVDSYMAIGF
jgi:ribose transport system substrate-binding protein